MDAPTLDALAASQASARPMMIGISTLYLVAVAVVGWWSWKRTRTAGDFFVAGRSLGLWVTALATMSSAFSGFLFLGGPGLTYRLGMASLLIVFPISVTGGMLAWTVAKRLRLLAEVREIYTVSDAVAARYGSSAAAGSAAVAVVLGTVAYLGAQLLALGVLIQSIFGLDQHFGAHGLAVSIALGLVVVVSYSVAGGMLAGVYTDVFQGVLMMLTAVAVFFYAWTAGGGTGALRSIWQSDAFGPSFLDPMGRAPVLLGLSFFFVFAVGVLGQPHTVHKFLMIKDVRKLRSLPAVLGLSQALVVLIWLGIGLAVPALVAQGRLAPIDEPDRVTPIFLLTQTPDILAGLVFAGVLAAIMSTADSFVNIASAALVRDLPKALGRPVSDELRWGRVWVVVLSVAAAVSAYGYGDLIALLGTFAYGVFAAALAPCLAIGLHWKRASAKAAVASIWTGLGVALGLELWSKQTWWEGLPRPPLAAGVLPSVVAMAASFTVFFVVSWFFPEQKDPDEDVAAVMEL